ncbi:TraB/GumN family protein [Sphingopyxis sp. PET50]|uniref:TraB/GumN family protein n=1 Tax=Sphingopyxis sp. PET50 TaxID=2976533 RepID=UPI0021AFCB5B|nr:TraB/GumN family protein [Sphingopyxis sp. PET50]
MRGGSAAALPRPCSRACWRRAAPLPIRSAPRAAMWLVEDNDTRLYMLGTMHALPAGTDWDEGAVGKAVAAADELVLELSPGELAAAGGEFQQLAPRDAPLPIDRRLPAPALAAYRALEASGNGQPFGGDALDDWAVMVAMGQRAAQNARLSPADGVETGLMAAFSAAGKPITGLETAREQLMLFETLDPATQRALLTKAAAGAGKAVAEVEALTAAWSRGDVKALEAMVNEDVDTVPAARAAIITERNRRWTAWASWRMDRPGTVLVAVGTGHLIGAEGMPAMLAAKGYKVVRVQ